MSMKGWAEAQNYPGGIIKYLFDKVKSLDSASGGDESDIAELKEVIGDESTEGTILARVKALEDAPYDDTEIKGDISALKARVKALEDAS